MRAAGWGVVAAWVATAAAAVAQDAVPTFHSVGVTWPLSVTPADGTCTIRYRAEGASDWRTGLPMWFDARDGECRGSLVQLVPATRYDIELAVAGTAETATLTTTTWSEEFPVGSTVELPDGVQSDPLVIDQGGTADGYVLYTAPANGSTTIDVADAHDRCVRIEAPYVIVRGLSLVNSSEHAVELGAGAHHVVIERNDISGWGALETDADPPNNYWGQDYDAAIYCRDRAEVQQVVVQRNRMHHPRSGSNSWEEPRPAYGGNPHPAGPQAVSFLSCGGNNVFRYNEVYSDAEYLHWFNDPLGGWSNFSTEGFPNADSDIYGNRIEHYWDDAIEAEGGNRNVRIWGNYLGEGFAKVAIATTSVGPLYIWRNLGGISRREAGADTDQIARATFLKAGAPSGEPTGGRIFLFHNTMLQPAPTPPNTELLGGGPGIGDWGGEIVGLVSRNNIFHTATVWTGISCDPCDQDNDFDYDLYNAEVTAHPGAEANGFDGEPTYDPANGPNDFALEPGSLGFDAAQGLPGFNDDFQGDGPDVGAHEWGTASMEFGVDAGLGSGGDAGTAGAGGGTGGTGTGGSAASGGAGADGATPPGEEDDGCGCRIFGTNRPPTPLALAAALLLVGGSVRRIRRRSSRAGPGQRR